MVYDPPAMQIREDDARGPEATRLLQEHLDEMAEITPPGSVHALHPDALRGPGITFWTVWEGEDLLGCGGLQRLDAGTGEIKAMHTAHAHRGRGVASLLLRHILAVARARGYRQLLLETGSSEAFAAARALYTRHGFRPRGPFASYPDDPHSCFFQLDLA